ncbi:glycosyl hydrolase [Arthrobacter agilis]|uniref:glycosyl hydrolase n=1 Tax=Arthrobacter agilis TaxID=37921 RepID=UPI002365060D|nr:glycosyl hydrolase [Arthrobacter agilis]WDF32127.1 glycosyl hydrolase [Arthrobacter agilis]
MFGVNELNALQVNWFYSWGSSYPDATPLPEFVPMIWGRSSVRQGSLDEVEQDLPSSGAAELLGFNEPDHPQQSDMSVARAVKLWPMLEDLDLRLGSPGAVDALGDWMKDFMDRAARGDRRIDFMAVHAYPSPDPDAFLAHVEEVHQLYGKPIWITEYAVADWDASERNPSRHSPKDIRTFMRETARGLREMPYVERFAWKTRAEDDPIMGASALFQADGTLTPTGELYRSL